MPRQQPADEPLWYKDAIIYQIHVRAFSDSNADGIGDFGGLTERLDYVQDLGVNTIWLLPFYPSPLRDDGYDIADYTGINPAYGDMREFRRLLREAHDRGIRVITELVLNHTSDAHPWFQRARRSPPGSRWRDYYVWSDTPDRYREARIIFQDFETSNWTYDNVAQAYYWHRFYSHQPDLNYESADVRRAMKRVLDRWLELGVDGVRLDAVPYLFEREGTNCENLPETHAFLRELRAHIDDQFSDRMLLAEANQWPEDAVAYFGDDDECHMAFHFPVMPRLFMALQMEHRHPIIDILEQTPKIPPAAQWAMFLRNHDELTLEMVTDEERDYMYRRYAADPQMRVNLGIRRRLAPLLQNDRRKIELLNGLLFSLPGTPIVYYGDEIGMGDNVYLGDRDAVRTPMQWNGDRNAGFSRANPQQLYLPVVIDPEYHYEALNVEAQQRNSSSLWWWMRRLIALRKRHPVFGRGDIEFLDPENPKVLAFLRSMPPTEGIPGETILVVANLSRHAQQAELDLRRFDGARPVELFGRTPFTPVSERPYPLTLAPHAFHWFRLDTRVPHPSTIEHVRPSISTRTTEFDDLLAGKARTQLVQALVGYMETQRWFAGKARRIQDADIVDVVPVDHRRRRIGHLVLTSLEYTEGEPEMYALAVALRRVRQGDEPQPGTEVIATLEGAGGGYAVCDVSDDPQLAPALVDLMRRGGSAAGDQGRIVGVAGRRLRSLLADATERDGSWTTRPLGVDQSNTSILVGERVLLKLLRKVEVGPHPDVEIGRYLTETLQFPYVAPYAGVLEYHPRRGPSAAVASMYGFVPNEGDAWSRTLDELGRFYEHAAAEGLEGPSPMDWPRRRLANGLADPPPERLVAFAAESLEHAGQLGVRTAQLHRALARNESDAFRPQPFTRLYQRSMYQNARSETRAALRLLRRKLNDLDAELREVALRVLGRESLLIERYAQLLGELLHVSRIRIHSDLHLGQVLVAGADVVFVDFEGEPARPVGERVIKRSALRDVAGILRSYDYATRTALAAAIERGVATHEGSAVLEAWGRLWFEWVSRAYAEGYLGEATGEVFVPESLPAVEMLLDIAMFQKAVYELTYELSNRPDWVHLPVRALDEMTQRLEWEHTG